MPSTTPSGATVLTGLTLSDASRYFDAEFDLGPGLDYRDTVTGLWAVRAQLATCKTRATDIQEASENAFRRGATRTNDGRILRPKKAAQQLSRKTVRAKDVEAYDMRIYDRARIIKPAVGVTAPKRRLVPSVDGLPIVPKYSCTIEHIARAVDALADVRAPLRAEEATHVERLKHIAEVVDWDGTANSFIDGWRVRLVTREFSADELLRIAPDVHARLLKTVPPPRAPKRPTFILAKPTDDPEDETDGD